MGRSLFMYVKKIIACVMLACLVSGCKTIEKENVLSSSTQQYSKLSIKQMYYSFEDNNNWYYFDKGLYKQSKKDFITTLISNEEKFGAYCMYKDWIYYVSLNQDVVRVKTNGEEFSIILNVKQFWEYEDEPTHGLAVFDDTLFIQMSFCLYSYNLKNKEIIKISEDAREFGILENKLYYCGRNCTIYEWDIQSETNKALLESKDILQEKSTNLYKNVIIVANNVYYYMRRPDGLYLFKNGESKLISNNADINEFSLFEHDNKLYYLIFYNDTNKLMQYDPITENVKEMLVCDDYSGDPKIKNGYFYYMDSKNNIKSVKLPS